MRVSSSQNKKLVILGLGIIAILAGCTGDGKNGLIPGNSGIQGETPPSAKPSPDIITDLTIVGTPSLNQPVDIVFTATSTLENDIPNSNIHVDLPEGFELLDGDLTWEGTLPKKGKVELKAKIKAVKNGEWKIESELTDTDKSFFNWAFLYVEVSETSGRISKVPFDQLQEDKSTDKTWT